MSSALAHLIFAPESSFDDTGGGDIGFSDRQSADGRAQQRDAALVAQLRDGDPVAAQRALSKLIATYGPKLIRFAAGIVGSEDTAEDVVQELFVRVWEGRGQLDPDRAFMTYCFTATHRRALNVVKHQAVQSRYAATRGTDATADATAILLSAEDRLDAERVEQAVRAALERLPERRRTVLRLRYDEELSFAAVGEVMGISEQAAKDLTHRAIRELRGLLEL